MRKYFQADDVQLEIPNLPSVTGCKIHTSGDFCFSDDTPLNPSTIDVMVGSSSKKTNACARHVAVFWEFISSGAGSL